MADQDALVTAFRLHAAGFTVIPSGGGRDGKEPLVKWAKYEKESPSDAELESWEDQFHPQLWGIITNENVAVIDADGTDTRHELEAELGNPHVITPRKGAHWYINTTGHPFPTKAGVLPGIDVRGKGGFVNICGSSALGEYEIVTLPSSDTLIPWGTIPERILSALNSRKPLIETGEPICEGNRNQKLASVAGSLRNQGLGRTAIEESLLAINNAECQPPLSENEVRKIATSISQYPINKSGNTYINNYMSDNSFKTGQPEDNLGTSFPAKWGEYAGKFDQAMCESPGPKDKRVISETIGLKVTDPTFRKILQRRIADNRVRPYRRSAYLIEWINRDYRETNLEKVSPQTYLALKFPLYMEERVRLAPGNVAVVAGYTSSGKTSFLLEFAELNAFTQSLPIYYWYNEMSEAKLSIRCEDFPLLIDAKRTGEFHPVRQGNFEFADVIKPNGINVIDYLDRNENLFLIGEDVEQLQAKLDRGIVIFALQKRHNQSIGYGGIMSIKRADLYVSLDRRHEGTNALYGIAEIVKSKEWADDNHNPVNEVRHYHTGGKHGKLYADGEWHRPGGEKQ